jgi:calcineurin-like phosphoesterase family protein
MLDPRNTFFIADLHFDHANIIKYTNRPFKTVEEMNETLLQRYNEVVKDDSIVFFLGDMAFGRGSRKPRWWLEQLRGSITYIKGSHDHGISPTNLENCYPIFVLDTGEGKNVLLTHEPHQGPSSYHNWEWQIHGHTHDTHLVDIRKKRICVSVEAIDYRPISLAQIREAIRREQTVQTQGVHALRR